MHILKRFLKLMFQLILFIGNKAYNYKNFLHVIWDVSKYYILKITKVNANFSLKKKASN